ncbi:MAG: DUF5123 domain-containing protein, partial [Aquificaceae bacterium]|nr:DUF5123 domain-containing protein [Aquificaceae bacterium]
GGGLLAILSIGKVKIYNNTFYNNRAKNGGGALIILEEDSAEVYVVNNIFWQNTAIAGGRDGDDLFINSNYDEQGRSSAINLYNNNFSGNANFSSGKSEDLLITKVQQGRYNHAGNVQVDPRFVNASAGDFRLQANSPLIDKGYNNLPSELLQKDKDGNPRVVGGAVDIGAYEFQGRGGGSSTDGL